MKAKTESRSHSFGQVNLHREEIEEILAVFTKACGMVELSDEKHVYDSLDEMEHRLGKTITQLEIHGYTPYLSLSLGQERIWKWFHHDENRLYADGSPPRGPETAFFKVREIVSQHQSGSGPFV